MTAKEMLEIIREFGENLTSWEVGFLTSLEEHLDAGMQMTPGREEKLAQIYRDRVPKERQ